MRPCGLRRMVAIGNYLVCTARQGRYDWRMIRVSPWIAWMPMLLLAAAAAHGDDDADTLTVFKNAGDSAAYFSNCYAYAVFPTVGEGGFIVGGARGKGHVYVHDKLVGDTTMSQISAGFQDVYKRQPLAERSSSRPRSAACTPVSTPSLVAWGGFSSSNCQANESSSAAARCSSLPAACEGKAAQAAVDNRAVSASRRESTGKFMARILRRMLTKVKRIDRSSKILA